MINNSHQNPFNGDAMLMMAWYADCDCRVTWINSSLARWLTKNNQSALVEQIRSQTPNISITEFLDRVLDPEDGDGIQKTVGRDIQELPRECKKGVEERDTSALEAHDVRNMDGWTAVKILVQLGSREPRPCLAGVRAFRPGGFRLRRGDEASDQDRVDLINVIDIDKDGVPQGFQGQLQEAWLRVHSVMKEGTRTATMGLLGRSMSHNIGSHALWHLESELTEQHHNLTSRNPHRFEPNELRRFVSYVRERSELIAGYATGLPAAPAIHRVVDIIRLFEENQILCKGIARSEQVSNVKIEYSEDGSQLDLRDPATLNRDDLLQALLPCGAMSRHALYMMLENIIRDAAKYRTNPSSFPSLRVIIAVSRFDADYLKMQVCVPEAKQKRSLVQTVQAELSELRFVTEDGQLIAQSLGIKERFVAAAHLRGRRPSGMLSEPYSNTPMHLGYGIEPRILWLEGDIETPSWEFYLVIPKGILVVTAEAPTEPVSRSTRITYKSTGELNTKRSNNLGQYQFIVLDGAIADEMGHPGKREAFPSRTFRIYDSRDEQKSCAPFVPLMRQQLAQLSAVELRRAHLVHLCKTHGIVPPAIVLSDSDFHGTHIASVNPVVLMTSEMEPSRLVEQAPPLVRESPLYIIRRHWTPAAQWHDAIVGPPSDDSLYVAQIVKKRTGRTDFLADALCLEFHETHDTSLRSLVGAGRFDGLLRKELSDRQKSEHEELWLSLSVAACTKILIADERLDEFVASKLERNEDITYARLFQLKGIDFAPVTNKDGNVLWNMLVHMLSRPRRYDFIVVHLGILEKIAEVKASAGSRQERIAELCGTMEALGTRVIIHSARTTAGVSGRILPYSSVGYWVKTNQPKLNIVEELNNLLRETLV